MVSAPEPVVMVFAAEEPVTVSAELSAEAVNALEVHDADAVSGRLVGTGRYAEIDRRRAAAGSQHQRIAARTAIDRGFAATVGHGVVAAAGVDGVGAAGSVDRVGTGSARDRVGAG